MAVVWKNLGRKTEMLCESGNLCLDPSWFTQIIVPEGFHIFNMLPLSAGMGTSVDL